MIQKNVNIQKMLYISRFWLYSKFNNLAKKNHTTNIEKSLWRNFNLQIYHRFNNEKNFSMSFTKNEFFKFLRRMLFTLALKRVLTISNKNIPYIPCCDILQWTFNKEQKTIFILPWKTTIYFFYYVYKIKGLLSFSSNESPSYIIILSRLPFRMNQLAKIQWHCPVIDDIVSSRWGEQSIQRGNSHAP